MAGGSQVVTGTGDPTRNGAQPKLEQFVYNDNIVRAFLLVTILWSVVAFLVGLIAAVQLAFPQLNLGLSFTTFGRLRPLHTNAAIFAFAGNYRRQKSRQPDQFYISYPGRRWRFALGFEYLRLSA